MANLRLFLNNRLSSIGSKYLFLSVVPIIIVVAISLGYSAFEHPRSTTSSGLTVADIPPTKPTLDQRGIVALTEGNDIVQFNVRLALADDMDPVQIAQDTLAVDYRDYQQRADQIAWAFQFVEEHDNDTLLESGELVEIQIPVKDKLTKKLSSGDEFVIDIKPDASPILTIHKTLPAQLNTIVNLN